MVDDKRLDLIETVTAAHWPQEIAIDAIGNAALIADIERARTALLSALNLSDSFTVNHAH